MRSGKKVDKKMKNVIFKILTRSIRTINSTLSGPPFLFFTLLMLLTGPLPLTPKPEVLNSF